MFKLIFSLLIMFLLMACASTSPNKMNVGLDKRFAQRQELVCDHFEKSSTPITLELGIQTFYENKKEKKARAILIVDKNNLLAWHCGEQEWELSQNIAEIPSLGQEIPKRKQN